MKKLFAILTAISVFFASTPALAFNHVVQRGETLTSIAKLYNTTVSALALVNGISNPNLIFAGDYLEVDGAGFNDELVGGAGGSYTPVTGYQSRTTSFISASASTIPVASTRDKGGNQISLGDVSSSSTVRVYMSLATGTSREEILYCTGVTATSWTGCVRGLSFQGGSVTASSTLAFSHNAGTPIIITDVGQFFTEYVSISGNQTIFDTKTFNTLPKATSTTAIPSNAAELATKYYVDNVGAGGFTASNVSTTRGLSVDGSVPERVGINASSTTALAFDSSGRLYINASSTGGVNFASNGSIQVDQTDNFNFTGTVTGTTLRTSTVPSNASDVVNLLSQDNAIRGFIATSTAAQAITAGQALFTSVTSTLNPTDTSTGTSTFYFVGFATANASVSAQVTYTRPGGINCNQSGLSPGVYYYLNGANGTISTSHNATYSARVAQALNSTCIRVLQPRYKFSGSVSTGAAANGSTFRINTFFYPARVSSAAVAGTSASSISIDTDSGGVVTNGGTVGGPGQMSAGEIYLQDEGGSCYWRGSIAKDAYGMTITNSNYSGAGCGTMLDMTIQYSVSNE